VRIGLDNLTLLDLRSLDPPPALGANLIMIIGTARSVKHLNVSADRFCRWLRSEWKLRPVADGLLGRNELKLKLRRKARRQKMMGLVGAGAREAGNEDDGITTGWVCVNIGMVDPSLQPRVRQTDGDAALDADQEHDTYSEEEDVIASQAEQQDDLEDDLDHTSEHDPNQNPEDTYIGFGSHSNHPRIVVQMFTDEKRAEMDLEGLWDWRNTRRVSKNQRLEERGILEELDEGWAREDRGDGKRKEMREGGEEIARGNERTKKEAKVKTKKVAAKAGSIWD
jgi:hypothetical protein